HIGEEGAQKTDTSNLQGNAQTVVITSAFSDKFLVCFIKVKISGSVAKIVKLEHAWRRLDGRNDDGFQVAPFPG
ncbi:hypothetical protein MYL36_26520, partial [Escherichia coli]|nr:hypothetical protein [Escherichia coli]